MKRGFFLLGSLLAAGGLPLLAPAGCTVLSNDAPLDAGVYEGGEGGGSKACPTCTVQQCTAFYATCFDSASCTAITTALHKGACDEGCQAAAYCGSPSAQAFYKELATCEDQAQCNSCQLTCGRKPESCPAAKLVPAASACGVDAGATDASDAAVTPSDAGASDAASDAAASDAAADATADAAPPETCAACVTRCGDTKKACAIGSECDGYIQCAMACADATCVSQCGTTFPSGKQASQDLARCVRITCGATCGVPDVDAGN